MTVDHEGECEAGVACGGEAGDTCEEGQFCKRPTGECSEDAEGTCTSTTVVCQPIIDPVCGCDGMTYDNACTADGAGVTVDHEGACDAGVACDGATGVTCPDGQFCKRPDGACSVDVEGVCTDKPLTCEPVDSPVCTCTGIGFPNACYANAVGYNIRNSGTCEKLIACDGATGVTCPETQFCKHPDGACGADVTGVCTDKPLTCEPIDDPVCACGGIGFPNACYANAVGRNIENTGTCEGSVACDGTTGVTCTETQFCKHPDGACGAEVEGVCTERPPTCAPIDSPVCACGEIGFPNACYANAVGRNIENTGTCGEPEPVACDGATGVTCPETQFCKRPDGACSVDVEGVCTDKPLTCEPVDSPVCTCTGIGFPNACYANAVGYNIRNSGTCEKLIACDGATGVTCPETQFCKHPDGACGADVTGVCTDKPLTCEPIDDPVCACGGIGFPNACYANAVGRNIENTGTCEGSVACDGTTGVTCTETQFCKHPDGACGAEVEGVCTERPPTCAPIDSPVCACGEIGFPNACYANAVGRNIENNGTCGEPSTCGGTAGNTCEEGEFCKRPEGECSDDDEGVCTANPPSCPTNFDPVCGCNGTTYSNACLADAAGVTVSAEGECAPPAARRSRRSFR